MPGILAYGAYVPYNRLERSEIARALGQPAGKGCRSVASYDEDSTSMAVEAARRALHSVAGLPGLESVSLASVSPPYLDKTNANTVHAALDLDPAVAATDRMGSVRAGFLSFRDDLDAAAARTSLCVVSDIRTGLAGGADERDGGDGAAAFVLGAGSSDHPVLAEPVGAASASAEFLDRWRVPGDSHSQVWEERFGEFAYLPLADAAFSAALKRAGATPDELAHLVVAGPQARAVGRFGRSAGVRREVLADDLSSSVGNAGAAQFGLMLAGVLDRARPGELIAVVSLADGADAVILRTTEALARSRSPAGTSVGDQVVAGREGLSYTQFLSWRGFLRREPPRRPDPDRPAAPPSYRSEAWKFAFVASRCTARTAGGGECGMRHLPPQRVCARCHAVDQMVQESLADTPATVTTFTIDRLAYSPSPPIVAAVLDFDGGGRFRCELTDVSAAEVAIGMRVEMTFRRLYTAGGVHDYFWKARPLRTAEPARTGE